VLIASDIKIIPPIREMMVRDNGKDVEGFAIQVQIKGSTLLTIYVPQMGFSREVFEVKLKEKAGTLTELLDTYK
jgi:hypothetical protein